MRHAMPHNRVQSWVAEHDFQGGTRSRITFPVGLDHLAQKHESHATFPYESRDRPIYSALPRGRKLIPWEGSERGPPERANWNRGKKSGPAVWWQHRENKISDWGSQELLRKWKTGLKFWPLVTSSSGVGWRLRGTRARVLGTGIGVVRLAVPGDIGCNGKRIITRHA